MTVVKITACRRGDLPFLVKTMAAVKAAMRGDAVGGMQLYGKTGTFTDDGGSTRVWWIGG